MMVLAVVIWLLGFVFGMALMRVGSKWDWNDNPVKGGVC